MELKGKKNYYFRNSAIKPYLSIQLNLCTRLLLNQLSVTSSTQYTVVLVADNWFNRRLVQSLVQRFNWIERHGFRASFCALRRKSCELTHVIYLKLTILIIVSSFPKLKGGGSRTFFLSFNNWGLNFLQNESLNPLRFTSHQKNWEKCLFFNLANDCLLNWANPQNETYFHSK